ncbi:hypothetical protein BDV95DRAFT_177913 [Massariosphaeria phaeospora]|uniref:Uncharacterized protein n=1 Tax=Massariosphaeria phaeospora TaxID=100035 RepID=A0A7C8M4D3_9PLEO|nr:hypothetical protein BDV95DRAFT_177913 [Massariosphaeria phaeospora]
MIPLRAPSTLPSTTNPSLPPPPLAWLTGAWNVTHSTLPMWKKSRNVRITYTPLAHTSPVQLDDVVSYQSLSSAKLKTVHGVDKPFDVANGDGNGDNSQGQGQSHSQGAADKDKDGHGHAAELASLGYNWRGKGWLVIASSKWEILGYGDEEGTDNQYVVTYFAATLFTPAGVDFYSRQGSLRPETVESIKAALVGLGGDVAGLATKVFAVAMDSDRAE